MQAAVQIKLLGAMQGALEAAQSAVGVLVGGCCEAADSAAAKSGKEAVQGCGGCGGEVWQRYCPHCCAGCCAGCCPGVRWRGVAEVLCRVM